MPITVKLEGADALKAKLRAYLTGSTQRVQSRIALTLLKMESDAKQFAPVDTGRLRSSIHANFEGKFSGSVSTELTYARWVHDGTGRTNGIFFLTKAYHLHKQEFLAGLKEDLKFRL